MPGARTHDIITVVTGVAMAPMLYSLVAAQTHAPEVALREASWFLGAHLISGIMFSPDLDLDSAIDDRWGIFYWIWRPYMWVVPHRHRILSHGLLSALLRLAYFYVVVMLLLIGGAWLLGQAGIVLPDYHRRLTNYLLDLAVNYPREVRAFLIGFVTGGAVHVIADWCVTGGKRYLRKVGIRIHYDGRDPDQYGDRRYRRRRSAR